MSKIVNIGNIIEKIMIKKMFKFFFAINAILYTKFKSLNSKISTFALWAIPFTIHEKFQLKSVIK